MSTLVVKPRARLFHGHVWVYATEIQNRQGDPKPGDVVGLKDVRGKPLGSAIYNPQSQISARLFSYRRQDLDLDFFQRRLQRALRVREESGLDTTLGRIVWSESDGLPGVVIDRYHDHVVLQTLTLGMARRQDWIVQAIRNVLNPSCIVERNDAPVRRAEGLETSVSVLHGADPKPFEIRHRGMVFQADLLGGQKTGLYLDQLENYSAVATLARGRRVLDCFANQAGFAQACSIAGADSVTAVDVSDSAIELARRNAGAANLEIQLTAANCFDYLKQASTEAPGKFDLIILDPPSFTRTKQSVKDALRGYKEIHLRSLKMLEPGGRLVTFTCSHHVSPSEFHQSLADAAVDARKTLRRIAVYTQPADHPVLATIPETEYLHGYAYEVLASW